MNWIVAGLIGGLVAYVADYVMWGKVFTKGMESYGTFENVEARMPGMIAKSAVLALLWGLLFAFLYRRFKDDLWVAPGLLAGMELATVLWAATILFLAAGSAVWYDKTRRLLNAQLWAWLVRMNAAGAVIGVLQR